MSSDGDTDRQGLSDAKTALFRRERSATLRHEGDGGKRKGQFALPLSKELLLLVDGSLQLRTRGKLCNFFGRNLDRFSGLRVATCSSLA